MADVGGANSQEMLKQYTGETQLDPQHVEEVLVEARK